MRLPKLLALATCCLLGAASLSALAGPLARRHPQRGTPADTLPSVPVSGYARHPAAPAGATGSRRPVVPGFRLASGGLPVSRRLDPAETAAPASAPYATKVPTPEGHVTIPAPSAASLPTVATLAGTVTPDAVVMLDRTAGPSQLAALGHLPGVTGVEAIDTGTVTMGGDPVVTFGVDPGSFRDYTPAASASSDLLWRYIAGGALVSSFEMATERNLAPGTNQLVEPAGAAPGTPPVQAWLGGFAALGLPGVDLLVDRHWSATLGLTPDSGLVVAAPGVPGTTLQRELRSSLPRAAVELLRPAQVSTATVGSRALSTATRSEVVSAALSRVGMPYVWGGDGPFGFDCSGLVQWAYRRAGILLPRVAAEQFLTGTHVPLSDAQPGDLLFWTYDPSDPGYVDHAAIYLGHGQMVVAPHAGTVVQVTQVSRADFAGAVEVGLQPS